MENFDHPEMYVTPPSRPHPQFSESLQTPPWKFYNEKVRVRKITGARKKLVNIFQNPMFGQPRPWKEQPQAEKSKEEPRKVSPYLKNKLNGKFHSMKQTSPKVMKNSFLFYKNLIIFF